MLGYSLEKTLIRKLKVNTYNKNYIVMVVKLGL